MLNSRTLKSLQPLAFAALAACSDAQNALQVGVGPDAGAGGTGPAPANGGADAGDVTDMTRALASACDLWGTGKSMPGVSGGPWHWFSHAVGVAWGNEYKNELDVVEQVAEPYLPLIKTTGDLECVTRDLLLDARARGTLGSFYRNWLNLDPGAPPEASPYTAVQWSAMVQDTLSFAIDTTASGVDSFRRLYTSPRPLRLAPDADPKKVVASKTLQAGLLSDPAVLARAGVRDFPTVRGMWLMETFACTSASSLPGPPDTLNSGLNASLRHRLEVAVSAPACLSCHAISDPAGYALAPFDPFGRLRHADPFGFSFETSGVTTFTTPTVSFDDLNTLGAGLARTSEAALCYAAHWNNFLFKRDIHDVQDPITFKAGELLLSNQGDMRAAIAHVIVQGILP